MNRVTETASQLVLQTHSAVKATARNVHTSGGTERTVRSLTEDKPNKCSVTHSFRGTVKAINATATTIVEEIMADGATVAGPGNQSVNQTTEVPRFLGIAAFFFGIRNIVRIRPFLIQEEIPMKAFANKQNSISLLTPSKPRGRNIEVKQTEVPIRKSFRGWLHSVTPTSTRPGRVFKKLPQLTANDVMLVNHATIREGESHRVWPPFAIERFLAAEVIRETNVPPYKITNANLRRISD